MGQPRGYVVYMIASLMCEVIMSKTSWSHEECPPNPNLTREKGDLAILLMKAHSVPQISLIFKVFLDSFSFLLLQTNITTHLDLES